MPLVIENISDKLTFTCPYVMGQQVWVIHQNRIKTDTVVAIEIRGSVRCGQPPSIRFDVELREQGQYYQSLFLSEQDAIDGVLGKYD
jgi:hypothetical protein